MDTGQAASGAAGERHFSRRLFVFPVVLGAGERLFGQTSGKKPTRLVGSRTVGNGLAFLTYEMVREA